MPPYPLKSYNYDISVDLNTNLNNLLCFHKERLYNFFNEYTIETIVQHNCVIDVTHDIVEKFIGDLDTFELLIDDKLRFTMKNKMRLKRNYIVAKSAAKINKVSLG